MGPRRGGGLQNVRRRASLALVASMALLVACVDGRTLRANKKHKDEPAPAPAATAPAAAAEEGRCLAMGT